MDIIISYENQLNLLCLEVNGCLTVESYQVILQKILDSTDFPCDVKVLWDLTDMAFNDKELDLAILQKELTDRMQVKRGFDKVALVSDNRHLDSYIELLGCVTQGLSHHAKRFKVIDEAMYWLVYGDN